MKNKSALLLSAGYGSRLRPYTTTWPKCLMPIHGIPLLEYWLRALIDLDFDNIFVNTHYHTDIVKDFLTREIFRGRVKILHEPFLLGTAGTIRENASLFCKQPLLLVHADNWCQCNLEDFINFHNRDRSTELNNSSITMMTFRTTTPKTCGIVELDENGVVIKMHEKVLSPPSNLANAAVYMIDPDVVNWISKKPDVTDFSTDVLEHFMGKIITWENKQIHRDIGSIRMLSEAQSEGVPIAEINDDWTKKFKRNPIHKLFAG
jgi:mannose-1-phosphate guanylyltransferase